jgi:hypothetical protein
MRLVKLAAIAATLAATTTAALAQTPPPAYPPPAPAPVAQPDPYAQPQPAPQTGVSQINGQLVPVGQHNEYYYEFKRWNVSTNPIGWVVGSYGASVSYGFHQNFAIRADVNYFSPVETDITGYEIGAGLPIYFRRTYQGAFLEPGFILRHFEDSNDAYHDDGMTTMGPQILFGWHWTWDSGLNIAIAAGLGRNWSTSDTDGETSYDDEKIFANGYLRFGYAF